MAALAVVAVLLVPVFGCATSKGSSGGQTATTTPLSQASPAVPVASTVEAEATPQASPAAGTKTAASEPPATETTGTPSGVPVSTKLGPGLHDFTLPDAHGGQVTLSQYLGDKAVVLTFYRAWW